MMQRAPGRLRPQPAMDWLRPPYRRPGPASQVQERSHQGLKPLDEAGESARTLPAVGVDKRYLHRRGAKAGHDLQKFAPSTCQAECEAAWYECHHQVEGGDTLGNQAARFRYDVVRFPRAWHGSRTLADQTSPADSAATPPRDALVSQQRMPGRHYSRERVGPSWQSDDALRK